MFSTKSVFTFAALPFLALLPVACSGAATSDGSSSSSDALSDQADEAAFAAIPNHPFKNVCSDAVKPGQARCLAMVQTNAAGAVEAEALEPDATPKGFGPKDLIAMYGVPAGGTGTIGIVDAQDDPDAESDLATYRKQYGLTPCTTANGCFKKVNQRGVAGSYPKSDTGWAGEIMLDIEMASAICPTCKIILVEADTADNDNLGASVNTAVKLGATVVSNSYGGPEDSTVLDSEKYYNHAGVAVFASSGDSGFGASYPASSAYVISVGGTSIAKTTGVRGWREQAWSGAGAGCSAFIGKPSWQTDKGCAKKTIADLSAIADPNTGVAVYDKFGSGGWAVYGGTSVASPVVASVFAATGNAKATGALVWKNPNAFHDVRTGNDGTCPSAAKYLCKAASGYDGPTGWGTPRGTNLKALAAGASNAELPVD